MSEILSVEEVQTIKDMASDGPYAKSAIVDLCDTIISLYARLHEVDAENELVTKERDTLKGYKQRAEHWDKLRGQTREIVEKWKQEIGFDGCYHAQFRDPKAPLELTNSLMAVLDALTQEGVPCWSGDGTSIVAQIIDTQIARWRQAEAQLAALQASEERLRAFADEVSRAMTQQPQTPTRNDNQRLLRLPSRAWKGAEVTEQPDWCCVSCGERYGYGWEEGHLATWHMGLCGICGAESSVTEPRDFGYLDMKRVRKDYPKP